MYRGRIGGYYTHVTDPNSGAGFCSLACTPSCAYSDPDDFAESGSFYYLISGERADCAVSDAGAEGSLGVNSFGEEVPLGGGWCP